MIYTRHPVVTKVKHRRLRWAEQAQMGRQITYFGAETSSKVTAWKIERKTAGKR